MANNCPTIKTLTLGAMPFGYCTLREAYIPVGCNNQRALHQINVSVSRHAEL